MTPLRIAIVHYHLRQGGVTSVISQAKTALERLGIQVAVLTGTPADQTPPSLQQAAHRVDGLGYDQDGSSGQVRPAILLERLREVAGAALGGTPDIWHFHNHTIGKNSALTASVKQLADQGSHLLMQIHDFPEDGRPDNYRKLADQLAGGDTGRLGACLYPAAPHVHYATLNGRDQKFLIAAGLPSERVHLLSNPVSLNTDSGSSGADQALSTNGYYIYPTRAIRRKNIGEFLLFAALAEPGERFAITLAPTTPESRHPYEQWMRFVEKQKLPVDFEAGRTHRGPFYSLLQKADSIVTTSVAEGFGLAFLEPWLVNRPLLGRDLPEITCDFTRQGIRLKSLYSRLDIPVDKLFLSKWRKAVGHGLAQVYETYGQKPPPDATDRTFAAAISKDGIDFGHLDEEMQRSAILHVQHDSEIREKIRCRFLSSSRQSDADIDHNKKIVSTLYNPDAYASRLSGIYSALLKEKPAPLEDISAQCILNEFLSPERFLLLRT